MNYIKNRVALCLSVALIDDGLMVIEGRRYLRYRAHSFLSM